jgi:hypothetical protein
VKHLIPNVAAIEVSESEYLRLSSFERFDDGSGYRCNVDTRCGEFGCFRKAFYFDDMPKVVAKLRDAYQSLNGSVEMRQRYEDESLTFKATAQGHFVVRGRLTDYRDHELRFALEVDQTYMEPFVSALERIDAGFTPNTSLERPLEG